MKFAFESFNEATKTALSKYTLDRARESLDIKFIKDIYAQKKPFIILSSMSTADAKKYDMRPLDLEKRYRAFTETADHDFFIINNHGNAHWDATAKINGDIQKIPSSAQGLACGAYTLLHIIQNSLLLQQLKAVKIILEKTKINNLAEIKVDKLSADVVRKFVGLAISESREELEENRRVPSQNIDNSLNRIKKSGEMLTSDDLLYACQALGISIIDANLYHINTKTLKEEIIRNLGKQAAKNALGCYETENRALNAFLEREYKQDAVKIYTQVLKDIENCVQAEEESAETGIDFEADPPIATSTPKKGGNSFSSYRKSLNEESDFSDDEQEELPDDIDDASLEKTQNSLNLDDSLSEIAQHLNLDDSKKQFLETHIDDSSDEEMIPEPKTRLNCGWKGFSEFTPQPLKPYAIIEKKIMPLEKQPMHLHLYKLTTTVNKNKISWPTIDLSKNDFLEYNSKTRFPLYSHIFSLLKDNPYANAKKIIEIDLQYSFLLHQSGVEALYEKSIASVYYQKKRQKLSSVGKSDLIQDKIVKAILDAIRNLCLSFVIKSYNFKTVFDRARQVCDDLDLKKEVELLARKLIEHRTFGYRYSDGIHDLVPYREDELIRALSNAIDTVFKLKENEDIYQLYESVIYFGLDKLRMLQTQKTGKSKGYIHIITKNGSNFTAPTQAIRDKSYEELLFAHNNQFPKDRQELSQLCKAIWELIQDMETGINIVPLLRERQVELFHDFIHDLENSADEIIVKLVGQLQPPNKPIPYREFINNIYIFMSYSLEKVSIPRPTLNDSCDLISTSFIEILANIRLTNRSQARKIRNFATEEGNKIHGETFIRNWGFGKKPEKFAIETQEITVNQARNDVIKNSGSYAYVLRDIIKLQVDLQLKDHEVANLLRQLLQGRSVESLKRLDSTPLRSQEVHRKILINTTALLFITETARNPASAIANLMILDLIENNKISWEKAFDCYTRTIMKKIKGVSVEVDVKDGGMCPMSMDEAVSSARFLHRAYGVKYKYQGEEGHDAERIMTLVEREATVVKRWLELQRKNVAHQDSKVAASTTNDTRIDEFFNQVSNMKKRMG